MTFFEIEVRHDQQTEKKQRVDDEQDAEPCISPREVSDAGRNQSNAKTKIRELFYFERNIRNQKRQHAQYFCGCKLYLEILRQSQMDECSLRAIWKRKMIVKDKIDYAKYHDCTDDPCGRAVNHFLSVRELSCGSRHCGLLPHVFCYAQRNPVSGISEVFWSSRTTNAFLCRFSLRIP